MNIPPPIDPEKYVETFFGRPSMTFLLQRNKQPQLEAEANKVMSWVNARLQSILGFSVKQVKTTDVNNARELIASIDIQQCSNEAISAVKRLLNADNPYGIMVRARSEPKKPLHEESDATRNRNDQDGQWGLDIIPGM